MDDPHRSVVMTATMFHLCEVSGPGGPWLRREVVLLHLGVPTVHRSVARDLKQKQFPFPSIFHLKYDAKPCLIDTLAFGLDDQLL